MGQKVSVQEQDVPKHIVRIKYDLVDTFAMIDPLLHPSYGKYGYHFGYLECFPDPLHGRIDPAEFKSRAKELNDIANRKLPSGKILFSVLSILFLIGVAGLLELGFKFILKSQILGALNFALFITTFVLHVKFKKELEKELALYNAKDQTVGVNWELKTIVPAKGAKVAFPHSKVKFQLRNPGNVCYSIQIDIDLNVSLTAPNSVVKTREDELQINYGLMENFILVTDQALMLDPTPLTVFPRGGSDSRWNRVCFLDIVIPPNLFNVAQEDEDPDLSPDDVKISIISVLLVAAMQYCFRHGFMSLCTPQLDGIRIPCSKTDPSVATIHSHLMDSQSAGRKMVRKYLEIGYSMRLWLTAPDKELQIKMGAMGEFYASSFDTVSAEHDDACQSNQFLRRFVRRLRYWGVIDIASLRKCKQETMPMDANQYHIVWEDNPLLDNVDPGLNIQRTCKSSVFSRLKQHIVICDYDARKEPFINNLLASISNESGQNPITDRLLFYVTLMTLQASALVVQTGNGLRIRKESMLSALIYTPLLEKSIGLQVNNFITTFVKRITPLTELNLLTLPAYTSEAYCDLSYCVIMDLDHLIPFFLAEYATDPAFGADSQYEKLLAHKDGEKLVASMSACMLNILEKVHSASLEELLQLRVWGVLVDTLTLQFLQMRLSVSSKEDINAKKIEMILFTEESWIIALQPDNQVSVVNPRTFLESVIDIWDISTHIARDGAFLDDLLNRVANENVPPMQFQFNNPPSKMPDSNRVTTTLETPKAKRRRTQIDQSEQPAQFNNNNNQPADGIQQTELLNECTEMENMQAGLAFQNKAQKLLESKNYVVSAEVDWTNHSKPFRFGLSGPTSEMSDLIAIVKPTIGRCKEECNFLRKVSHSKHVVKLLMSDTICNSFDDSEWTLMVMPRLYDDKYEILQLVQLDPGAYLQKLLQISVDAMTGLQDLHLMRILHRDIKPPHIMHDRSLNRWILIDLDCSVELPDHGLIQDDRTKWSLPPGTDGFRAPEVEHRQEYGFPSDIYSLGMTLLYIAEKKPVLRLNQSPSHYVNIFNNFKALLRRMTLNRVSERPLLVDAINECLSIVSKLDEKSEQNLEESTKCHRPIEWKSDTTMV